MDRRGLVVEREGRVFETDALKTALRFIAQLDGRMMTSTASRLAVVQREIDNLAAALNPDPQSRTEHLQRRIARPAAAADDVQAGRIAELTPEQAVEGIREGVCALRQPAGGLSAGGGFVARGRPCAARGHHQRPPPPGRGG